ncbi:MAG: coiled-coil domain-containing protein [Candidatus Hodarchaeales archaeon]
MVLRSIERIRKALPEVEHIVMFYNDGTVFKTTFDRKDHDINIPKLGENMAEILEHMRTLYEICKYDLTAYRKLVFDTDDVSLILLKVGEDTNIALFFKKEREIRIRSIRRYIKKIEDLIDVDRIELMQQKIEQIEEKLKQLFIQLEPKLDEINNLRNKLKEEEKDDTDEVKELEKEIKHLNNEIDLARVDMERMISEIADIQDKISAEEDHEE